MPNTVRILRSTTAGATPSSLVSGQIAINESDGRIFYRNAAGVVTQFTAGGGGTAYVVEADTTAGFPATGSANTIYLARDSRRIYSWTANSVYAELGAVSVYDARFDLFLPPAPTGVTGTPGNAQVALTWTAPTAYPAITDYTVQYSSNSGSTWTTFTRAASSATSATVTGLTNNTYYTFRVAAVNAIGTGSYSSASASIMAGYDPFFSSVALLLHCDGTGSTFTDSSGTPKTITANGGVTQSTAQSKFGGKSALFSASGDYLTLADQDALELLGGDFAIEMWIRTTSSTQYATLIGRTPASFSTGMWALMINHNSSTAGDIALYVNEISSISPAMLSTGVNVRDGAWHHIAISRSGTAWSMYADGSRVATATSAASVANISGGIRIGADQFYGRQYDGYIDDLRFTKGSARNYTGASITVPTFAFPDV